MLYSASVLILHDSRNSKSSFEIFYLNSYTILRFESLLSKSSVEIARISVSSHRFVNWSKSNHQDHFYNNRTELSFKQELRKCKRYSYRSNLVSSSHLHTLLSREIAFMLRDDFATSNRFYSNWMKSTIARAWRVAENTHSNKTCVCLNISKLFCIETTSQHHVRSTTIELNRSSSKRWRIVRDINTNQICFRFDISTLFAHQESRSRFENNIAIFTIRKSLKKHMRYTYKSSMRLLLNLRFLRSSSKILSIEMKKWDVQLI